MPKSFSKKTEGQKLGYRSPDFVRRKFFSLKRAAMRPVFHRGPQHKG